MVTLLSPSMRVDTLVADSAEAVVANTAEAGVYWLEVTEQSRGDPRVVTLLPLVRGGTLEEAARGWARLSSAEVTSAGDIITGLNGLREELGLRKLAGDPALEEIARDRAITLAQRGELRHLTPGGTALPELMRGNRVAYAENIARGAGFQEAWSMILVSPTHVSSCLSRRFSRVGVSSALAVDSLGWQLVLVQVFADGQVERGRR